VGAVALLLGLLPALLGSFTRSAWIGTLVAITVVVARFRARVLPFLGVAAVVGVLLLPPGYRSRALSAFDTKSVWNVERVKLWTAGAGIVRDHPVTGVGLQDLRSTIDRYRTEKANEVHGHLHNVWLQVAATMGIVGLAALVALWIGLFRTAAAPPSPVTPFGRAVRDAALGALAGFLVAGLFEWNLGDEELVNFLATLVGAAFAARGWRES
jgi:O-antigen ligase